MERPGLGWQETSNQKKKKETCTLKLNLKSNEASFIILKKKESSSWVAPLENSLKLFVSYLEITFRNRS